MPEISKGVHFDHSDDSDDYEDSPRRPRRRPQSIERLASEHNHIITSRTGNYSHPGPRPIYQRSGSYYGQQLVPAVKHYGPPHMSKQSREGSRVPVTRERAHVLESTMPYPSNKVRYASPPSMPERSLPRPSGVVDADGHGERFRERPRSR